MKTRALQILWPAFLVAGVLDALTFAVVDPSELRWFGGPLLDWPPLAVYSATFLIFWAAVSTAGAMTSLLSLEPAEVDKLGGRFP